MALTDDERADAIFATGKFYADDDRRADELFAKYSKDMKQGGSITKPRQEKHAISTGAAIGSIIGGVAGGALTAGAGGAGAIPGAIAGAAVGELAQQGYDKFIGKEEYAPKSVDESIGRVVGEAGNALLGEVGGAAVMSAKAVVFGRPVSYGQARQLTHEQMRRKAFYERHQIPFTADQIVDTPVNNFARTIADNGFMSDEAMAAFRKNQNSIERNTAQAMADEFGQHVPTDQLAVEVSNYISGRSRLIQDAIVEPWYNTIAKHLHFEQKTVKVPTGRLTQGQLPEMVDKTVTEGGLLVDIRPMKEKFSKEVAELEKLAINAGDTQFKELEANNPAYVTMKRFLAIESPVDGHIQWATAHMKLKDAREALRSLDNPLDVASSKLNDKGHLIEAEKMLESGMEKALQNSTNPAHQEDLALWKRAQAVVKGRAETFKDEVILQFANTIDKRGGDTAWKKFSETFTAEEMARFMKATRSNPELQGKMKQAWLEDRIIKAGGMKEADEPFDAAKFEKLLFGKDEASGRKAEVLFTPAERAKWREFTDIVTEMQSKKGGTLGETFIRLNSASAIFNMPAKTLATLGLVTGGIGLTGYSAGQGNYLTAGAEAAGTVAIVFGPKQLASLLTNQRTAEYMIQGMRYSATHSGKEVGGTPVFNSATGQWETVGGTFSPSITSQITRVVRELMRLDQGVAQTIRAGAAAYNAEQADGPLHKDVKGAAKTFEDTLPSNLLQRMQ